MRKITKGHIVNAFMIVIVCIMIINPNAKSLLIRGLMSVGFFQPEIPDPASKKAHANSVNISFRDTKGTIINTADLKGKVIFINFWATWCPPCIAEMPSVNQLYTKFKNNPNVAFITVDVDNDFAKANSFMQKHHYNLPVYTLATPVPDSIMGGTIPTTLIFNKNGELVYKHTGAADYNSDKFVAFLTTSSKP
ncbi:TlpA family protein disulfide reductase [Mucilaginibacter sp. SP1R1]|uniref:TlpA family protein disulfide reductase n=1 Tax=Mucilaginibacter sp. SP1R1 TaxID=2723091 RepID=UPI0016094E5C|nr:TlpA disulfide reductase family protein [Mucilaginibacter sp. SP1R1]MBB6148744.1 thiol-disulfide isomerase/thioredoxin [Mucilaginibacter sp. SP1R1]